MHDCRPRRRRLVVRRQPVELSSDGQTGLSATIGWWSHAGGLAAAAPVDDTDAVAAVSEAVRDLVPAVGGERVSDVGLAEQHAESTGAGCDKVREIAPAAREHATPIRTGINAGSLVPRLSRKCGEATSEALAGSACGPASWRSCRVRRVGAPRRRVRQRREQRRNSR